MRTYIYFFAAFFFIQLLSSPSFAADVKIEVMAKPENSEQSKLIPSDSVILNKSQIRGIVKIGEEGNLTVKFISTSGKENTLINGQEVAANSTIALPSDTTWYDLDDNDGKANFVATFRVKGGQEQTKEFIFYQVPRFTSEDSYSNLFDGQISGSKVSISSTAIPTKGTVPEWLNKSVDVASKIVPEKSLEVRGATGAAVYKKFAGSVLLIATDDGIGSGSIIDERGEVLTNYHVIKGFDTVAAIFKPAVDGKPERSDIYSAKVVKVDEIADLALLQITAPPKNLNPIPIGTLQDVEVGADVHAIGHPTGEVWSYTQGTISQVRPDYVWKTEDIQHVATVIQTQTPINPGSSGGPLITDSMKLVGVNSFLNTQSQNLNFAVSAKNIREFLDRKESIKAPKPAACEPKSVAGDPQKYHGRKVVEVDTKCDGKIHMLVFYKPNGKTVDYMLEDLGPLGIAKIVRGKNGKLNTWLISSQGDGKIDVVGIDDNDAGSPNRFVKVN